MIVVQRWNDAECYKFINGEWKPQNPPKDRLYPKFDGYSMQNGSYLISPNSCSGLITTTFLPNGQEEWKTGPEFKFSSGDMVHFIQSSKTNIIGTGGTEFPSRIFKFNVETKEVTEIGKLQVGRWMHTSAIFNGKLIVTGGFNYKTTGLIRSTDIIDLESGISRLGGNLNVHRCHSGMGVITLNGKQKLIVFGGELDVMAIDSIEEWDEETETWKISDLKLGIGRHSFRTCTLQDQEF